MQVHPLRRPGAGGITRCKNPPNYDMLLTLLIVLGIWPGTSRSLILANAGMVWALVLLGLISEVTFLVHFGLHRALVQVLLKGGIVVAGLVFSLRYFGQAHGFEYVVALLRKTLVDTQLGTPASRSRVTSDFRLLSLVHIATLLAAVVGVSALELKSFDYYTSVDIHKPVPHSLCILVKVGLVVRTAFTATFLMFFSLTCALHTTLVSFLRAAIVDIATPSPVHALHRLHGKLLISLRTTSSSFSIVIALILVQTSVQFLYLTWDSMISSRGMVYIVSSLLTQTAALYIVTIVPAYTSHVCAGIAYAANSLLGWAAFAPLSSDSPLGIDTGPNGSSNNAASPGPTLTHASILSAAVAGAPPGSGPNPTSTPQSPTHTQMLPLLASASSAASSLPSYVSSPEWRSQFSQFTTYASRADFHLSFLGVPLTPAVAAIPVFTCTVWAILAIWMSITRNDDG